MDHVGHRLYALWLVHGCGRDWRPLWRGSRQSSPPNNPDYFSIAQRSGPFPKLERAMRWPFSYSNFYSPSPLWPFVTTLFLPGWEKGENEKRTCWKGIIRADAKLKKLTERSQLLETSTFNGNLLVEEEVSKVSLEDRQRSNVIAQQRRTTMILASMVSRTFSISYNTPGFQVLIFGATWLPHNVITLIIEYNEGFFHDSQMDHTYLASMIAHLWVLCRCADID